MPKKAIEETDKPKKAIVRKKTISVEAKLSTTRSVVRKAPPREGLVKSQDRDYYYKVKLLASVFIALILIAGASYVIGNSDDGQINVSTVITKRVTEDIESGGSDQTESLQALNTNQNRKPVPNGGLVGRGNKVTEEQKRLPMPAPSEDNSSTTASSTDENDSNTEASTTDEEISGNVNETLDGEVVGGEEISTE